MRTMRLLGLIAAICVATVGCYSECPPANAPVEAPKASVPVSPPNVEKLFFWTSSDAKVAMSAEVPTRCSIEVSVEGQALYIEITNQNSYIVPLEACMVIGDGYKLEIMKTIFPDGTKKFEWRGIELKYSL